MALPRYHQCNSRATLEIFYNCRKGLWDDEDIQYVLIESARENASAQRDVAMRFACRGFDRRNPLTVEESHTPPIKAILLFFEESYVFFEEDVVFFEDTKVIVC
jgi:hypothetical protein